MGDYLKNIHSPEDIKSMKEADLYLLCDEIRQEIIETVSNNGGHLASNLGVVELTVALGRVFSQPEDRVIWDVGHQCYPYKLLTGRYNRFSTIRTEDGLSGFPSREESPYDVFTSGHSSTSISAALGVSEAKYVKGEPGSVVAIIGDGALSGGLAYEGLNNAGRLHRNFIVILNDNHMSISKNVGSMARYLTYMRTKPGYIKVKSNVESTLKRLPVLGPAVNKFLRWSKRAVKKLLYSSTIFQDFGFAYYGPFDGHNIRELTKTLESAKLIEKPVLIHVKTNKGRGYRYAEQSPSEYHGLSGFDVQTGFTGAPKKSFSDVFGETLCRLAEENSDICAVTAAMQGGTGLTEFRSRFRKRFYDVGIAEGHAVTFSAGLAADGVLPVFAVYSTFLQRAYDELIHDISLQNFKMILAIDRAGVVGEDGKTHQGVFDTSYLQSIPDAVVYSPSYFSELELQLRYLVEKGEKLCCIRYPRGIELYKPPYFKTTAENFSVYGASEAEVALVTYGRLFSFAAEADQKLHSGGHAVKLLKLNRIIPLDEAAVTVVLDCRRIYFYEEGMRQGGVGVAFSYLLQQAGFRGEFILRAIDNPFIAHAPMYRTLETLKLNAAGMEKDLRSYFEP